MQVPNKTKKSIQREAEHTKVTERFFWNCRRRRCLGIVIVRRSEKILVTAFVEIDF